MTRKMIGIVVSLLVVGCLGYSCAPRRPLPFVSISKEAKTRIFEASYDDVWQALILVLNEDELPICTIEKESGVIVTDFVRFGPYSSFAQNCLEEGLLETIKEGRYRLNVLVIQRGPESVSVRINAHIEKFSKLFFGWYRWHSQATNGYIEYQIFQAIEIELPMSE